MKIFRLLLFSFLFLAVSTLRLKGQNTSTINNQVAFINDVEDNLTSHVKYMKELHNRLELLKINPTTFVRFETSKGLRQPKIYFYDKVKTDATIQALWKEFNVLNDLNNELSAYIRLEDHKSDLGKLGLKLIGEMSSVVGKISEKRNLVKTNIYAKRNAFASTDYGKVYQLMLEMINHEEEVLDHLENNYGGKQSLNGDFLIASYLKTTEKLQAFNQSYAIKYPCDRFLGSFLAGINSLRNLRQSVLDKHNFEAQRSSKVADELYHNYLNYFNNDALEFLKSYVEAAKQHGIKLNLYPKHIAQLRTNTFEYKVLVAPKSFQPIDFDKLEVIATKKAISVNAFNILNNYINALNERTRSIKNSQNSLDNLQTRLQYMKQKEASALQRYDLHHTYDSYKVPVVDYHLLKTYAPKYLPNYATSLNLQFENIQQIVLAIERLNEEITNYAINKKYVTAGVTKLESILVRIRVLLDDYEILKENLYTDIRRVYKSYNVKNPSNPFTISSKALLEGVYVSKAALTDIKAKFYAQSTQPIDTESLLNVRRSIVANQAQNMDGIKRIGRNNGHCPYNPYEDLPNEIKRLVDKVEYLPTYLEKNELDKFEDFVYIFNSVIDDYNKFADLSMRDENDDLLRPVMVLKTVTTFAPFVGRNRIPQVSKNSEVAKTPPVKENTKPNKASESVSLKNSKNEPAKENNNASLNYKLDTVYIETVKTDTVYLHEDDVDFTSFEGYAHNNLVFLLDASGSMGKSDRMPLLKSSINYMVSLMRAEDELSIVVYSGKAKVELRPTSASEQEKIKNIIEELKSEGVSNVSDGIKLAIKTADGNYKRGGNNRIVLATDGQIQVSKSAMKMVAKFAEQDIQLSVFTFGGKASKTIKALVEAGKGNHRNITKENVNGQLIREAKSKKLR